MATYVLVHGGCHGSWCWDKVAPFLKAKGHIVETPNLPGHGRDKTPIHEVTLQACVGKVSEIIRAHSEPVILVGHSIGGIVISQVAEQIPERIELLVYLTADLLKNGESLEPVLESFRPLLDFSEDKSSFSIKSESVADLFYNDCSPGDVERAKALLVPEATAVFKEPLHLSDKQFGRVPRVFIQCLRDQTIPPQLQKAMYTATPCAKVFSMNTGHSPFLSAPEQLAACLLSLAD